MDKKELLKSLGVSRLPTAIDLDFKDGVLFMRLYVSSIEENMQNDASAFEGWIFCLKYRGNSQLDIQKVRLNWEEVSEANGHYNRFLYRVHKLIQLCSGWFDVDASKKDILRNFYESLKNGLVLNYPINDSKGKNGGLSESSIEVSFVSHHELYKGVKFDVHDRQLPVGVFKDSVARGNEFFTGGKSAIDLWGLRNDELWIFELKYKNCRVGILSELLFYMWVMEDVFLLKNGICYPDLSSENLKKSKRSFDKLYKHEFEKIVGVLLIDLLHPLVSEHVIMQINKLLGGKLEMKIQKYEVEPLRLI